VHLHKQVTIRVRFHVLKAYRPMIETASTSETSVNFYQTTRYNNPEVSHLQVNIIFPSKGFCRLHVAICISGFLDFVYRLVQGSLTFSLPQVVLAIHVFFEGRRKKLIMS
jgi:hypothetical protein